MVLTFLNTSNGFNNNHNNPSSYTAYLLKAYLYLMIWRLFKLGLSEFIFVTMFLGLLCSS